MPLLLSVFLDATIGISFFDIGRLAELKNPRSLSNAGFENWEDELQNLGNFDKLLEVRILLERQITRTVHG